MFEYYIIPKNVHYVEHNNYLSFEKTNKIDKNIPTVVVISESKYTRRTVFFVVYKGMLQTTGGSGSCYNPTIPTFLHELNPMDNNTMPQHMSKWVIFSYSILYKAVIAVKYKLLKNLGIEGLPFWYWNCEGYDDNQGLLIGKLDLIGMNKQPVTIIKEVRNNNLPKLLNSINLS